MKPAEIFHKATYVLKVSLLNKCDGKVLIFFLNFFTNRKLRFGLSEGDYFVTEKSSRTFFLKERFSLYIEGPNRRVLSLAKNYGLDSICFKNDDVVIDVGANNGDLASYFKNQTYIGFEPSPVEYKLLVKNKTHNSSIFNCAVGNSNLEVNFFVSSAGANSSMIEPVEFTHQIKVNQVRLDEFYDKGIKLLKIDAEGAELEVLQGCKGIIHKIEYIAVDAGFERGVDACMTAPQVFDFLYQNKFHLIDEPSYTRYLFKNFEFVN